MNIDANNTSGYTVINTHKMFDLKFIEDNESPIDTYINKIQSLSTLVNPTKFNGIIANLILLGTVSAFESYMREVIRRTILIDTKTMNLCESMPLSYGAAISHNKELMPEAILEDLSFAGKNNVKESIKNFIGIKGHLPNSLDSALDEFNKVCEIRHCLVHRFGKLGAKNAIKLGLADHRECIEKPLLLDYHTLQEAQIACNVAVKEINNYIFNGLLNRMISDDNGKKLKSIHWKWDYKSDKKNFLKYYTTFVSLVERPPLHKDAKAAYDLYRIHYNTLKN